MKIAVIRGEYLTKWEMQGYEPMLDRAEVVTFGSKLTPFSLETLRLPLRQLLCLDPYINRSRVLRGSVGYALGRRVGRQLLLGLEQELAGFDIAHSVETFNGFTYQAARAKKAGRPKLIMSCFETIPFLHESERPMQGFKRYVHKHADIFLAMSQRAADALRMEGVDERRIRVHFPGIDLQRFRPLPRPASMEGLPWRRDHGLRVLLVGSITPAKGIREFLMAAAELAKMPALRNRVEFALVGKTDSDGFLPRMISALGVQDVVTHQSAVAYAEMPRLYASADLFVLPSIPTPVWEEQFGMVLAESMACGRAVVSTRSGAIPEVVGDAGLLVPPYDHLGLADAIADLLLNEEKRHRVGDYAATRARELFDCQRFADDMYTLYTELLA